jgi:hypothetical protein
MAGANAPASHSLVQEQAYMNKMPDHRPTFLHRIGTFLLALVTAWLLASLTATQSVISSLRSMGVDISLAESLDMMARDIVALAGTFLPLIAGGYLVAFLVAWMLCLWWPRWRTVLYILAGGAALVVIHLSLKLAFGITPIAIGRTTGGLVVQGLAGAVGGYIYIRRQKG